MQQACWHLVFDSFRLFKGDRFVLLYGNRTLALALAGADREGAPPNHDQSMKAIFCLPAHPSYFGDEYTQDEIDTAIKEYDRRHNGLLSKGMPDLKVKVEFLLLREPGRSVGVRFDSSGLGDGQDVAAAIKEHGIDQYRRTSLHDLQTHVGNLKNLLETKRLGYW
jgi:hypothetical protein